MSIFSECQEINDLIVSNNEVKARNSLIRLLDVHKKKNIEYTPLLNHLIRQVGLYPYLQVETSSWQDRFAFESFKSDVGGGDRKTLHREQSYILKKLMEGSDLAVSAPTSFGKSFIVDSFISLRKPKNIVIIVPTVSLTNETRRRLQAKFANEYKIITTADVEVSERNIFIFPQERAIQYLNKIDGLDMLIVDEFYKASDEFDQDRSPSLVNAILKFGKIAKQKYFLAPNISKITGSVFTDDMEFLSVDFNTVCLEKYPLFEEILGDDDKKEKALNKILSTASGKTLIYAGTYKDIDRVSSVVVNSQPEIDSSLLRNFELWLSEHYDENWGLVDLIKRGAGIHNGQLHRSLSQIQVRLFEEEGGLKSIISTSSIIEGVNTSAENVVLWRNRNGRRKLNDFTYKNIIGRGGRMFKYFVGNVYILEEPPLDSETELDLGFPEGLVERIDEVEYKHSLSSEQIAKIIAYREEMSGYLGADVFNSMQKDGVLESGNSSHMRDIAKDLSLNGEGWNGIGYLNSDNVDHWDRFLFKALKIQSSGWGTKYGTFVYFVKVLSRNWICSIPEMLRLLEPLGIGINDFFKLERNVTFRLSSIFNDVNVMQKSIIEECSDISPFISKLSHAFLPPVVYDLEEYGLPRMISRKIHLSGVIDFDSNENELHSVIGFLKEYGIENLMENVSDLDEFDRYVIGYFYEGI